MDVINKLQQTSTQGNAAMKLKLIFILIAIVALFAIVGTMDYQDALDDEAHYCQMVKDKAWPAYRKEVNCK